MTPPDPSGTTPPLPRRSLLRLRGIGRLDFAMPLSDADRALLEFEESWWQRPGAKATAIRRRFGFSPSAYYRRLASLVDSGEAMEHAPLLVRRLRVRRAARRRHRFEGAAVPDNRQR